MKTIFEFKYMEEIELAENESMEEISSAGLFDKVLSD